MVQGVSKEKIVRGAGFDTPHYRCGYCKVLQRHMLSKARLDNIISIWCNVNYLFTIK